MKVKHNLFNDFYELLRGVLKNAYGFNDTTISSISDEDLPFAVIYFEEKKIIPSPRKVHESSAFFCPPDMLDGWKGLKLKIQSGDDLTPYLSKEIIKLNYQDKMLNEWGVYHFHLGTNMTKGFINRTGPLLFAFVKEQDLYAVNIYNHNGWAEDTILQTVHDDWPELISHYKVEGAIKVCSTVTPEQRIALRKVNGNSFFTAIDGTVYAPTGGGSVASGRNMTTTLKVLATKKRISDIGRTLNSLPDELKAKLISVGYMEGEEVDAKLIITDAGYYVSFTKHNLIIEI